MKVRIKIWSEVDVRKLLIKAQVRYWEDAVINGVNDYEGTLTPCREGDLWCPEIDLASGTILNWQQGVKADIHFKVCDAGSYYIIDDKGKTVLSIENNYVPNGIVPGEYGDYIIMQIDETGKIFEWPEEISLDEFMNDED